MCRDIAVRVAVQEETIRHPYDPLLAEHVETVMRMKAMAEPLEFVQPLLMCVRTVYVLAIILIRVRAVRAVPITERLARVILLALREAIILVPMIRELPYVLPDSIREAATGAVVRVEAVPVQAADAVEDKEQKLK